MDIETHPEQIVKNVIINSPIKKRRKKTSYKKISNETRQKLVEMVYVNDSLLKDAARILNINYSTAKTILRIFRIEKRIEKKNAEEEKQLKNLVTKIITTQRNQKENCGELRVEKNLDFLISNEKKFEVNVEKKESNDFFFQSNNLIDKNLVLSATGECSNEQVNPVDKTESLKDILKNLLIKLKQNEYKNYSLIFYDFTRVVSFVDDCYKNIKTNQNLINCLIDSFYKINCNLLQTRNISK